MPDEPIVENFFIGVESKYGDVFNFIIPITCIHWVKSIFKYIRSLIKRLGFLFLSWLRKGFLKSIFNFNQF